MDKKINNCGCGGEGILNGSSAFWVLCNNCLLETTSFKTKEIAVQAWNTAHPEHNAIASVREVLAVLQDGKDSCAMSGDLFNQVEDMLLHLELPEISNAMQAVKWLEEKKTLECKEFSKHTLLKFTEENGLVYCNKNGDDGETKVKVEDLISYTWQLYEETKYKEITSDEALTDFALNGENKKIVLVSRGQEFYITRIENTIKFSSLSNPLGGMDKSREQLQGLQWRIYEN